MKLVFIFAALCAVARASPKGGQCYDCNYAPDGLLKNSNGTWAASTNDIFHHCGLVSSDNANYINKRKCISGRCFVRKDDNGMVFRGCADQWNLPWGTDTSKSCEQQAYQGSVWWFCDGDLCNNINIETECGSVIKTKEDPPETVVENIRVRSNSVFDPDHEVSMGDPDGGVLYAYPEPMRPGYETVHGQEYAYWMEPQQRKRRPIDRKGDGFQTRQTAPQDDVYFSRISGQPVVAEQSPDFFAPVPQPEESPVMAEPMPVEINAVHYEPQPEASSPVQSSQNFWSYFPYNYNNDYNQYWPPFLGYFGNYWPWKSSYETEKPKKEEPKPEVKSYRPKATRTEVNVIPAKISYKTRKEDYPAQPTVYLSKSNYQPSEPIYNAPAPEPRHTAPKMTYTKPEVIYKVEYEAPAYVDPAPAPEQPVMHHSFQTNDDSGRRDYYADRRRTDTGYDRPYVYFAESNDPYYPPDERGQTRLGKPVMNPGHPCDGQCLENPTGLFANPADPSGFIQCGSGFRNSGTCDCCVPYFHNCPEGTVFDDVIKNCGQGREVNGGNKHYSAVQY